MPNRSFIDAGGIHWRVWSTIPGGNSSLLAPEYGGGWLTFECANCLRRLAPIPTGWELASPELLELLCQQASEVPRHTGPIPRLRLLDDDEPGADTQSRAAS